MAKGFPLHCKACDAVYNAKKPEDMLCPSCLFIALGVWETDEAEEYIEICEEFSDSPDENEEIDDSYS